MMKAEVGTMNRGLTTRSAFRPVCPFRFRIPYAANVIHPPFLIHNVRMNHILLIGACCLVVLVSGLAAPGPGHAATISDLAPRAAQAKNRANQLRTGGKAGQLDAIGVIGPLAMEFVAASDLSTAVKTTRASVRQIYTDLSAPLQAIYKANTDVMERWMQDIMAVDGDLEALYEEARWTDAQDVAARALYFLNWLKYVGSFVYEGERQTQLLKDAINGFSEFASGPASSIKRETLFGRALSERELGEYDWAINDFEALLKDKATSPSMRTKVTSALAETRRLAKRGKRRGPSPEDLLDQQLAEASGLFERSQQERGTQRRKTRERAIGLVLGVKESDNADETWRAKADTLLAQNLNEDEKQALDPYMPWHNAAAFIRKGQYAKAIPVLRTVLESDDARAQRHKQDARYYLGDALLRTGRLRRAVTTLDSYLNGGASKNVVNAAYLRFKAAEALFAQSQNQANGRLYVNAARDLIRRDTRNRSKAVHEAHFRLGEYQHGQENYLEAVNSYQRVRGNTEFRFRADFAALQSYFSIYEQWEEEPDTDLGISPDDLKQGIRDTLAAFEQSSAAFEKQNPKGKNRENLRNYRGRVKFMHAVLLSEDTDTNAAQIADLLHDFEQQYPVHKDAFETVARVRLVTLEKAGRFEELEKNVATIFATYDTDKRLELLTALDQVLARDIRTLKKQNDSDNLQAAKRTLARLYSDKIARQDFAADESQDKFKYELAQLYLDVRDYDQAATLYTELQDGPYSLVSLAGLARIAEVSGDKERALAYWEEMLQDSQAGDPIWFRGSYEVAVLNVSLGNARAGCRTARGTRTMLNRLGDQQLKKQIQDFVTKNCGV